MGSKQASWMSQGVRDTYTNKLEKLSNLRNERKNQMEITSLNDTNTGFPGFFKQKKKGPSQPTEEESQIMCISGFQCYVGSAVYNGVVQVQVSTEDSNKSYKAEIWPVDSKQSSIDGELELERLYFDFNPRENRLELHVWPDYEEHENYIIRLRGYQYKKARIEKEGNRITTNLLVADQIQEFSLDVEGLEDNKDIIDFLERKLVFR